MNDAALDNKYQYNGKEWNDDFGLNMYPYGARWYDPSIGRFIGVDPISDKFPFVSTFNYAENEPVGSIDLHGLQKVTVLEKVGAFLIGAGNAVGNNLLMDAPGTRMPTEALGSDLSGSVQAGQVFGDLLSIGLGGTEVTVGGGAAVAGALAAPESGGASLIVAGGGAAVAVHGAGVQISAIRNLLKDAGIVKANDGPQKGKRRAKESDDANKQYEGLKEYQDKAKKERPSNREGDWEGSKRPHQKAAESDKKSKNRAEHQNKRTGTNNDDD